MFRRKQLELLIQIIFWLFLLLFSYSLISQVFTGWQPLVYSGKTILTLMVITYINMLWLIPRFFLKKKFGTYMALVFVIIIAALALNYFLTNIFFPDFLHKLPPNMPPLPPDAKGFPEKVRFIPLFFLSIAILFISTLYKLYHTFVQRELETNQLEKENINHELNFLRSQINPHFLFNALNNIHATVQLYPQEAGNYILKLGEMLRYALEGSKMKKVSLKDEINYIKNYIFFQQRKDDELKDVQFNFHGNYPENIQLEPMLFIPLLENAFVHSFTEKENGKFIHVDLSISNNTVSFLIENNYDSNYNSSKDSKASLGVGLKNIKRRLEILYPNRHQLKHGLTGNKYSALLVLHNI